MNNAVIAVTRRGLGSTPNDHDFGMLMVDKFFHTLEGHDARPHAVCFYTEGVKLTVEGSPIEPSLRFLAGMGVRVVICQTCLQHYGLEGHPVVGEVGGMTDIVELMMSGRPVVTI